MSRRNSKLTDWLAGTPSMVGEYNASVAGDRKVLRWWNGESWSKPYYPNWNELVIRRNRRRRDPPQVGIKWRGLVNQPTYPFPPGPLEDL